MSTQSLDGNAADAPHMGAASGSDANPIAGAIISPGKSARSFARPTAASSARSSALPRAIGSANLRQISNPAVPGAFGNEQQGYDADLDDDEADVTQIRRSALSHPVGFHYPALRQRSDAQRTDNPFTYQTEDGDHTSYAGSPPPARKVTGYVIPKTDVPQGSQPTLAAYEYDANGEPMLRKDEYKTALNQESIAHNKTKEQLKAYASTVRPSLHGNSHDSASDESDGPAVVRRNRLATKPSPDAPLPATTQRRSKQPEPAVFEGPTGTKASTYQKWKLDIQSWFRAHPYPFAGNEGEQLDYIRMKTTGVAWDNISSGWFIEGEEFHTAQEAWDILDACYGRLNTRLDAHNFYEKEGFMKPSETITSYLARFKAGVAPLKWDDEEKTLQVYKKLPDQWRSRAEHLMSDDTFTKDFANPPAFSQPWQG
ncbi:Retrotran gag 2 domain containing protein [Pyrenophora teres f. maculata]|nr:Retrotran gag 2 domain containing protein [Pyrenophora teres f. maculata]